MACSITEFTLDCREDVGGVKRAFLYGGSDFEITATAGAVTSITIAGGTAITSIATLESSTDLVEIQQPNQSAGLVETGNFSAENGTAFYQTDLTISINSMTSEQLQNVYNIGKNHRILAIVEDNNGKYWFIGNDSGCIATASTGGLGTNFGDRVGHQLTLSGFHKEPTWEFDIA